MPKLCPIAAFSSNAMISQYCIGSRCRWYCEFAHDPVKLGTQVFRIVNGRSSKGNNFLNVRMYYASWSNIREIKADFGKTVFLTREEADAAMKKMEG